MYGHDLNPVALHWDFGFWIYINYYPRHIPVLPTGQITVAQ
jgi:hypothetical protein